jgi:radical SAM superfamily enzyme YgiQ (UPF0313 family)
MTMKIRFIFPKWPKIPEQTPFDLPPLGVIQAAACVPEGIDVGLINENVETLDLDGDYDLACISIMLASQAPRAYEIARMTRSSGRTVVLGGQHVTLCPEEASAHADAVVVGEAEGQLEKVIEDFGARKLKKIYRREDFTDLSTAPLPRRDLHSKERLYTLRGWEMMDLLQTSRGCRFNCFPCSVTYLEGAQQRRGSIERTLADVARCGKRIFLVDNSLDQNLDYQRELLAALAGMGRRWVSHPIHPDPQTMKLARQAGWWYVYLAIYKINEQVRDRIKMYHDNGIGVEGTVMLGVDYHTEDFIRRLLDFLMDIELDLAEFTVMTPFPHSRLWRQMEEEGRIIDRDWSNFNAATVVFRPKHMSPDRLTELYYWAWETFYRQESQNTKMGRLLLQVLDPSRKRRKTKDVGLEK